MLDHLVHLSPPGKLNAITESLSKFFTIVQGGTHVGGITNNNLIPLANGEYIELIQFAKSPQDLSHRWGSNVPGWIDYALLGKPSPETIAAVDAVAGSNEDKKYLPTVDGGRTRPDGVVLEWFITAPGKAHNPPGALPFYCGDKTPRELRVPSLPAPHPSGTFQVKELIILTESLESVGSYLTPLFGTPTMTDTQAVFCLFEGVPGFKPRTELVLALPDGSEQIEYLKSRGSHAFYETSFWTEEESGKEGLAEGDYGRFRFQRFSPLD